MPAVFVQENELQEKRKKLNAEEAEAAGDGEGLLEVEDLLGGKTFDQAGNLDEMGNGTGGVTAQVQAKGLFKK